MSNPFDPPKMESASSIPNRTPTLIGVSAAFLVLSTAFFAARLMWRGTRRVWARDDPMCILVYLVLVTMSAFLFTAGEYGFGKHRKDIPGTFSTAMFYFWMYQIFYKILGGLTKLTFCILYLLLFPQKPFRKVVYATAAIIVAGTLAFTIGTICQCIPLRRNWDRSVPGKCLDFNAFWYSHAAFNTLMDVIVYILPIPLIRTLNMAQTTKSGLTAIFALGAFTIAASIIRMTMLSSSADSQTDPTWGSAPALMWTEIEANTAVICCCLPALRLLAVKIWKQITKPEIQTEAEAGNNSVRPPYLPPADYFGNITNVRYSPPPRPPKAAKKPSLRHFSNKIQVPFVVARGKRNLSDVPEEETAFARTISDQAPKVELSKIYADYDIEMQSRPEAYRYFNRDISLQDILREGPPSGC